MRFSLIYQRLPGMITMKSHSQHGRKYKPLLKDIKEDIKKWKHPLFMN